MIKFAAFKTKRTRHTISIDGFFYVRLSTCILQKYKAVQIPAAVIEICQFSWSRIRVNSLSFFYYLLNSLAMTKRMKLVRKVNNSSLTCTPSERNADSLIYKELLSDFAVEKEAKNQAYAFILKNNLFNQFKDFCDNKEYEGFFHF